MTGENDSVRPPEERKKIGRPRKIKDPDLISKLRRQVGITPTTSSVGGEQIDSSELYSDKEIQGTIRLQPEKNFFDQPPFETTITEASEASGVSQPDLRFLFRRLLHHHQVEGDSKMTELLTSPKLNDLNSFFTRVEDKERYPRPTTRDAMRYILETLQDFPDIDVYTASYLKLREIYKNDGTYNPPRKAKLTEIVLPQSYMSWWEERRTRYARTKIGYIMIAAAETFPQDLTGQRIHEVIPQGTGSVTRKWRIRKASETVRERRKK